MAFNALTSSDVYNRWSEWFNVAKDYYNKNNLDNHNAFAFSTVSNNKPSTRMVLLKAHKLEDNQIQFTFFTNLESRKAQELKNNPNISMLFHWNNLQRQIRVEGIAAISNNKVIDDEYFASRPYISKIGAWASSQSKKIEKFDSLNTKVKEYMLKYPQDLASSRVPRPSHWGSVNITASYLEFWQEKPNRLHNRDIYTNVANNNWEHDLLYP